MGEGCGPVSQEDGILIAWIGTPNILRKRDEFGYDWIELPESSQDVWRWIEKPSRLFLITQDIRSRVISNRISREGSAFDLSADVIRGWISWGIWSIPCTRKKGRGSVIQLGTFLRTCENWRVKLRRVSGEIAFMLIV